MTAGSFGPRRPSMPPNLVIDASIESALENGQATSSQLAAADGTLSTPSNVKVSRRMPFVHAPSTPMFYSHSQDSEVSNPYEETLPSTSANVSPNVNMHSARLGSISGQAGFREKAVDWQDEQEEDYEDRYAGRDRRPSRLGGSLSGSSHYTSSNKQPLLGGSSSFSLEDQELPRKGFLSSCSGACYTLASRRLPLPALLPALVLGAIFMALYDSGSAVRPRSIAYDALDRTSYNSSNDLGNYEMDLQNQLTYHANGHAYLSESALHLGAAKHPIYDLIRNATDQWNAKQARQSKTLTEAVREYRRRYNRAPPKGFDHWYRFATSNNVGLVDEYDSIQQSIFPFLSLPRNLLLQRQEGLSQSANTHTLQVRKSKITITGAKKDLKRAKEQSDMLEKFVQWIPDLDIVMSAHDGPAVMMDHALKDLHVSKAKSGQSLSTDEAETVDDDPALWGFPLSCPPHSRIRRASLGLEIGALSPGPSFVADHTATMDLCKNPEWQYLHGFTSWPGARPSVLMPLFSFARSTMHSDILCVPLEQYWDLPPESEDPPWEDKSNNKLVWRGSTTGVWFERETWWRSSQRMRLVSLANDRDADGAWGRKVRFIERTREGHERIMEREVDPELLEQRYLDVGFAGKMGQCTVEDGSCEAVPKYIKFVESLSWPQQDQYKYIMDVDGNAWSGRFHRLLSSNSLILKSTIFPEWYADRIAPWIHYVPVKIDYSDLFDIMSFFAGDMQGENGHDELAKKIATDGKTWANTYWRYVDMQAYAFRLYLEWARVTASDPAKADYVG